MSLFGEGAGGADGLSNGAAMMRGAIISDGLAEAARTGCLAGGDEPGAALEADKFRDSMFNSADLTKGLDITIPQMPYAPRCDLDAGQI